MLKNDKSRVGSIKDVYRYHDGDGGESSENIIKSSKYVAKEAWAKVVLDILNIELNFEMCFSRIFCQIFGIFSLNKVNKLLSWIFPEIVIRTCKGCPQASGRFKIQLNNVER